MKEEKKLTLDKDNELIGGVGSGIAKYLGVDANLIRIILIYAVFRLGILGGLIFYGLSYYLLSKSKGSKRKSENGLSYYDNPNEGNEDVYEQEEFELDEIMDSHTDKENIAETSKEDVKEEEKIEEVWEEEPVLEEPVLEEPELEEPELEEPVLEEPKLEGEEEVTTIDEELGNYGNEIN